MIANTPLITTLNTENEVHLIVGSQSSNLSSSRISAIIESGASALLVHPKSENDCKTFSAKFSNEPKFSLLDRCFQLSDLTTLGRPLVGRVVDRVFVNLPSEDSLLIREIYQQCIKLRIPINTSQRPEFSNFNLISTYNDPAKSGLQIAVTTNGQGCLLANRIKREVISRLPSNISQVVINMGQLRDRIINEDHSQLISTYYLNKDLQDLGYGIDEDVWESHRLNKLVHEFNLTEREQKLKRSRWLSQVMEYYPLNKLAELSIDQLAGDYTNKKQCSSHADKGSSNTETSPASASKPLQQEADNTEKFTLSTSTTSMAAGSVTTKKGSISLVGSGPGSISMLTLGALHEIKTADFILADKLVPEKVLELIPSNTETFIARKFPGNAERAQEELLEKGLAALEQGKKVVRLKQGDPYIFGRGGEEFLFFSKQGYEPLVLPGLSSSLASTVVAKIPATQRDVADQVLICTGTGRKGVLPQIPEFVPSRTTVFLMALHRSETLIQALLEKGWDANIPAAIVERASCPDQRITRTSLKDVPEVVKEIGSRPPGLLVVGNAISVLAPEELLNFNNNRKYHIEEGYHDGGFENDVESLLR